MFEATTAKPKGCGECGWSDPAKFKYSRVGYRARPREKELHCNGKNK